MLSEIEGVDVESGILRIGGNEKRYWQLLHKFIASQGDAVSRIQKALAAGKNEEALSLLHTLKGASGNVSAVALYESARQVESLLKATKMIQVQEELVLLSQLMQRLAQGLETYQRSSSGNRNEWYED